MPERYTPDQARALMAKHQGHQPESVVLDQCRSYLRTLGWMVVRMQQGMGCHKGLADLYCLHNGRSLWVECKATKGRQSDYQRAFEADVKGHGGEYIVVNSIDMLIDKLREV